jgi:putative Mn2+ efflux pump MntP
MKMRKMCTIAGLFAFFQALMPFLGWILITTVLSYFEAFKVFIPWIALALLGFIGGKMLYEGIKNKDCDCECGCTSLSFGALIAGLCTNAGAGMLILFRNRSNFKENFKVLGVIYLCSVIPGIILHLTF